MITTTARALVNATNATTVAGTIGTTDTIGLTFTNANLPGFPVVIGPVVAGAGGTATTVATALVTAINKNRVLAANDIIASNAAGVITVYGAGSGHNTTVVTAQVTGTTTAVPASGGALSGGVGTVTLRTLQTGAQTQVPGLTLLANGFVSSPQQKAVDPVAAGIDVSAL